MPLYSSTNWHGVLFKCSLRWSSLNTFFPTHNLTPKKKTFRKRRTYDVHDNNVHWSFHLLNQLTKSTFFCWKMFSSLPQKKKKNSPQTPIFYKYCCQSAQEHQSPLKRVISENKYSEHGAWQLNSPKSNKTYLSLSLSLSTLILFSRSRFSCSRSRSLSSRRRILSISLSDRFFATPSYQTNRYNAKLD